MDENPSKDQLLRRIPLDLRIQLRNRLKHSAINYIDNGGLEYRSPECCISNGILLSVVNATENWTVSRKCHGMNYLSVDVLTKQVAEFVMIEDVEEMQCVRYCCKIPWIELWYDEKSMWIRSHEQPTKYIVIRNKNRYLMTRRAEMFEIPWNFSPRVRRRDAKVENQNVWLSEKIRWHRVTCWVNLHFMCLC